VFDLYPGALQERTNDGFLPLHVAAQSNADLEVLYFLATMCPKAIRQ
jgi:hypothetical protein